MKNGKIFLVVFSACLCATAVIAGAIAIVYGITKAHKEPVAQVAEILDVEAEDMASEQVDPQLEIEALLAEQRELLTEEARLALLEELKNGLITGTSTVETLRPYYPNDIVLITGGQYHFVPIIDGLKRSNYQTENLSYDDRGFASYAENGEVISHKGIDVSKFQGKINWDKVKEDGVEFAFIRVGYRGYGESGTLNTDATFEANMAGANRAGIHAGVYFYTQAINEEELLEEVDLVLKEIAPYKVDCPVVFDVEKVNGNGRMNNISVEERTKLTILFCEKIKEAGYKPMIYQNMEMGSMLLDMTQLEEYDKWFAYYGDNFYYPYAYDVWQYSESGVVRGVPEKVDLNISFKPLWEE